MKAEEEAMTDARDVLRVPKDIYGETWGNDAVRMYGLYLEQTDRLTARRQNVNKFFIAIHAALLSFMGYVLKGSGEGLILVCLGGIALCAPWFLLIFTHWRSSNLKLHLLGDIEKHLPIGPLSAEDERDRQRPWGIKQGASGRKISSTSIEMSLPIIFVCLYCCAPWFF